MTKRSQQPGGASEPGEAAIAPEAVLPEGPVAQEVAAKRAQRARKRKTPFKHAEVINVYLWDRHIGAVALDPRFGFYAFAYTDDVRSLGWQPSPLRMPVREDPYVFPELPEATFKRLPAMLADALPDDFGNALINAFMADKGVSPTNVTPLDRLGYMGGRSMGALTFRPVNGPRNTVPSAIKLGELVQEARQAVSGFTHSDDGASAALRTIIDVGTSAGGARAKAVIAWNRETEEIRSGQMDAPPGFEHWLLKFDGMGEDKALGPSADYGRIEWAYHRMARAAGIDMTECRLMKENGRAHFMTRRFDRDAGNVRHHVQTLCAMAHLDYRLKGVNSYAQLFTTIRDLDLGYEELEEAFRRMVFNVVSRNCDDHSKNFSFLMRQGGAWELAPAYDVCFAHNPAGEWTAQHLMSVAGKWKDFTRQDLLEEANRFGIGTARGVIDEVLAAVHRWKEFAGEAGVSEHETDRIAKLQLTKL